VGKVEFRDGADIVTLEMRPGGEGARMKSQGPRGGVRYGNFPRERFKELAEFFAAAHDQ
jgi:hypothetical protein